MLRDGPRPAWKLDSVLLTRAHNLLQRDNVSPEDGVLSSRGVLPFLASQLYTRKPHL